MGAELTRRRLEALAIAGRSIRSAAGAVWKARAEVLTASAFLVGWMLLTRAVVSFTTPKVWPASIGLLAISLGGWRLFLSIILDGLYVLTLDRRRPR